MNFNCVSALQLPNFLAYIAEFTHLSIKQRI